MSVTDPKRTFGVPFKRHHYYFSSLSSGYLTVLIFDIALVCGIILPQYLAEHFRLIDVAGENLDYEKRKAFPQVRRGKRVN